MKIGLVSYECKNKDIEYNLSQIKKAMIENNGTSDILCFGETFLQGFVSLCWDFEIDRKIAISQQSQTIKTLCQWTIDYNVGLITGYIEIENEKIYSSCIVIYNGKIIHNYRRISKGWKEFYKTDFHFQEGTAVEEFSICNKKFLITLCGDLWDYPEKFKTDNILIWPIYVNFSLEKWNKIKFDYAAQSYKASERVLVVNPIDKNPESIGGAFYFEKGKIIKSSDFGKEQILVIEV